MENKYENIYGNVKMMKKLWKRNEQDNNDDIDSFKTIDKDLSYVNFDKLTPIQTFYHGESILITGGTGFLGKLLIEKLLRGCPGIKCIYLLIRSKKGKDVSQRLEEMFENVLFSRLKEKEPTFRNRIIPIEGDCSLSNLGISIIDNAELIKEISIIFHVAATVKFNEKIKLATAINVRSLKDLINLSKNMPKLKSFVHVSSIYANCMQSLIEEKFYEPPMDPDKLINLVESINEKLLDEITPRLLGICPNSYVYTKAVAENVVKKNIGIIPIGIFRPAIVISTYREPIQGWVDNIYGPIGIGIGIGIGLIRVLHCDGSVKVSLVPSDMVINGLIASAWDIAYNLRLNDIPIYNYVSKDNPITYDDLKDKAVKYGVRFPTEKAIWYYSFRNIKHRLVYIFYMYFLHLLPALIVDTFALCIGKQPKLLKIYNKVHQFSDVLDVFSTTEWHFTNERWEELLKKLTMEDRQLFFCDIKELIWDTFFKNYMLGIRLYVLKDPIETLPQARIKWRRLYWIHQTLKLIIASVFLMVIWTIILRLFAIIDYA
ncbi:fatty acyl-CoA reductase wat-like isoform X1 [Vespa crabro]|uniref:fatty acyl-CoA reductase wat-like isoform X1 n=2 Tax=Vespa crabro TaxID=7445 RepID=UPI001EFFA693|nr:fatty acyl-CoA reductase wat-like isoform X1 [Vespa crabro]